MPKNRIVLLVSILLALLVVGGVIGYQRYIGLPGTTQRFIPDSAAAFLTLNGAALQGAKGLPVVLGTKEVDAGGILPFLHGVRLSLGDDLLPWLGREVSIIVLRQGDDLLTVAVAQTRNPDLAKERLNARLSEWAKGVKTPTPGSDSEPTIYQTPHGRTLALTTFGNHLLLGDEAAVKKALQVASDPAQRWDIDKERQKRMNQLRANGGFPVGELYVRPAQIPAIEHEAAALPPYLVGKMVASISHLEVVYSAPYPEVGKPPVLPETWQFKLHSLAPAEAKLYFSVQGLPEVWNYLVNLASEVEGVHLIETLASFEINTGIDIQAEILSHVSNEVAITAFEPLSLGESLNMALLVDIDDPGASLTDLRRLMRAFGRSIEWWRYQDVDYWRVLSPSDAEEQTLAERMEAQVDVGRNPDIESPRTGAAAYTRLDGSIAVGNSIGAIKDLIEVSITRHNLAQLDEFRKAVLGMDEADDATFLGYATQDSLSILTYYWPASLAPPQAAGIAGKLKSDGIDGRLRLLLDVNSKTDS